MKKQKIFLICGARPNFVKISPLWNEINKCTKFRPFVVHTGQHYDYEMSKIFFRELKIPKPHFYLGANNPSRIKRLAQVITSFEKLCKKHNPALIIVVGDVDSTLACALASKHLNIRLAHVEAGLRSFDTTMPEEINRIITDHLSDILFTTCKDADINLKREGISTEKIFFVGNIMIDTLIRYKKRAAALKTYKKTRCARKNYALLTLHRPENVDNNRKLKHIFIVLSEVSKKIPIIFPCHPRTANRIKKDKIKVVNRIKINPPLGYLDFLNLMINSKFILTDSGGIQEEATVLKVPCLTLRNNTERPITVKEGTNIIIGTNKKKIIQATDRILNNNRKEIKIPEFWDGKTAKRIIDKLVEKL